MAVDPITGYVFTGITCSGGACPNNATDNEFGVAVGKPACSVKSVTCPEPQPASGGAGPGEFGSESYQTVSTKDPSGNPWPEQGSLFPIVTMGSDRTLYEAWIEGHGSVSSGTPPADSWHVYYAYSTDLPDHKRWSKPVQIDKNIATNVMAWIAAGDSGKLAVIWLGSGVREYPSDQSNPGRTWHPYMAVSTNANTSTPSFQQAQVGSGPNHLGDICLMGTLCGATSPPGNRNMADFISIAIGPDGAAQGTWASDANQISTLPTSLVPGVPVTMTARQVAGPKLIGTGSVTTSLFSTSPTSGVTDATGDALYPVWPRSGPGAGTIVSQLDLTGAQMSWNGAFLQVQMPVASLASLASPDTTCQTHVWWLTTWRMNGKIYFAKAESDGGGPMTFTAGVPASYDRPGLTYYTIPTLVDYRGGTTVSGTVSGNTISIAVPPSLVGSPSSGTLLEAVTAYTALDNGLPPILTEGTGTPCTASETDNVPTVVDATPAFNFELS
jgi:hypothetical protein